MKSMRQLLRRFRGAICTLACDPTFRFAPRGAAESWIAAAISPKPLNPNIHAHVKTRSDVHNCMGSDVGR